MPLPESLGKISKKKKKSIYTPEVTGLLLLLRVPISSFVAPRWREERGGWREACQVRCAWQIWGFSSETIPHPPVLNGFI